MYYHWHMMIHMKHKKKGLYYSIQIYLKYISPYTSTHKYLFITRDRSIHKIFQLSNTILTKSLTFSQRLDNVFICCIFDQERLKIQQMKTLFIPCRSKIVLYLSINKHYLLRILLIFLWLWVCSLSSHNTFCNFSSPSTRTLMITRVVFFLCFPLQYVFVFRVYSYYCCFYCFNFMKV